MGRLLICFMMSRGNILKASCMRLQQYHDALRARESGGGCYRVWERIMCLDFRGRRELTANCSFIIRCHPGEQWLRETVSHLRSASRPPPLQQSFILQTICRETGEMFMQNRRRRAGVQTLAAHLLSFFASPSVSCYTLISTLTATAFVWNLQYLIGVEWKFGKRIYSCVEKRTSAAFSPIIRQYHMYKFKSSGHFEAQRGLLLLRAET